MPKLRRTSPRRNSRSRWLAALTIGGVALAAFSIPRGEGASKPMPLAVARAAPRPDPPVPAGVLPKPEPLILAPVAPQKAAAINAAIPIAAGLNPAASPFVARARTALDQLRSHDCLAQAIYYEARSEDEAGQRAVAQVVLNRLRHPAYPRSVCGVVYQGSERRTGCQFTFTCDGSLAHAPREPGWSRARRIAAESLAGKVYGPVGHATHYHTNQVLPYWAPKLMKSAVVGAHIFYRWNGGWGRPGAFRQHYAGVEPATRPIMPAADPGALLAARIAAAAGAEGAAAVPENNLPKVKYTKLGLPESTVREAYRRSGAWRVDPAKTRSKVSGN
jgi:hypothetical protein